MKRLTINQIIKNLENATYIKCETCDSDWHDGCHCNSKQLIKSEELNVLRKYSNIEEKLGIDLITLFEYVDDNKIKEFVECFKFETMDNPNVVKIKIKKEELIKDYQHDDNRTQKDY